MNNTVWKETKSLGSVCVNENGNVVYATDGEGLSYRTVYPYRAHMVYNGWEWRQDGWDNCSGRYSPSYLAKLMRDGKAMWA